MRYGRFLIICLLIIATTFLPFGSTIDTIWIPGGLWIVYFLRGVVEVLMFGVGAWLGYRAGKVDRIMEARKK